VVAANDVETIPIGAQDDAMRPMFAAAAEDSQLFDAIELIVLVRVA
jgi:hypothetical protein